MAQRATWDNAEGQGPIQCSWGPGIEGREQLLGASPGAQPSRGMEQTWGSEWVETRAMM